MNYELSSIDVVIIVAYGLVLLGMGVFFFRRAKTSEHFMVAGQSIPAWAAGIAVMSTYTSSISYIAVPGKAFDDNWHPFRPYGNTRDLVCHQVCNTTLSQTQNHIGL